MSVLKLDRVTKIAVNQKGRPRRTPDNSGVPYVVRVVGESRALAYVERDGSAEPLDVYLKNRKRGVRSFALWGDQHRTRRLGTVRTAPQSTAARATYVVYDAAGVQLGTVSVEKASAFPPRRTRWTLHQAGRAPALAKKGRVIWWWIWFLLLPLMAVTTVISLLGAAADVPAAGTPKRTIWRGGTQAVLDYRSGGYHDPAPWLAPQLTAALVALHQSHQDGIAAGEPWDAQAVRPAG